jgi:hypothetical protein
MASAQTIQALCQAELREYSNYIKALQQWNGLSQAALTHAKFATRTFLVRRI